MPCNIKVYGGKIKICCACSAGGHLSELTQLEKVYEEKEHFFLTDQREDSIELAKNEKTYFAICPRKNPVKLAINFFQALGVFLKEKPDVVISTGADTAIPFCLIAKFFGKKIIFIESFCRIKDPSLSGKIMYGKADLFLVQWKENLEFFPKAKFAGSVF